MYTHVCFLEWVFLRVVFSIPVSLIHHPCFLFTFQRPSGRYWNDGNGIVATIPDLAGSGW